MKKLLDSDWLRAVQLKSNTSAESQCNTSAKSVIPLQKASLTPVQITSQNSWIRSLVHRCQIGMLQKFLVSFPLHWKIFRGFSKFSKHFQTLPKISQKYFQKLSDRFANFPTFSNFFWKLLKISEDFRQLPKIFKKFKNAGRLF